MGVYNPQDVAEKILEVYNPQDVAKKIMESLEKARSNMENLNIMVMGKTGVGKSTLINSVFNEPLADTGVGRPITEQIRKYHKDGFPLSVYDTPGLELNGQNSGENLKNEVKSVLKDGFDAGDINKAIHCIWYCVASVSSRFESVEEEFIKEFSSETKKYNIPIILVLTKSYSINEAEALKDRIEGLNLNIAQVVPVLACDYEISDEYTAKAYGLKKLIQVTDNVIPEAVRKTLEAVQKVSIDMKVKRGHAIVATAAGAAAVTALSPIPFSDAALLVPEQISMITAITAAFGLPIQKSTMAAIISATIGTGGATVLGKTVVTNLIKFIPGAGTVIGGVISSSTAATITGALGEAYIGVLVLIAKGEMKVSDLETEKGKSKILAMFKEQLKLNKKWKS